MQEIGGVDFNQKTKYGGFQTNDSSGMAARIKKRSNQLSQNEMPPLQMEERIGVRMHLNQDGTIRPMTTTMTSLFEPPSEPDAQPLMLKFVAKCNESDPCPLMPSAIPPIHLTR